MISSSILFLGAPAHAQLTELQRAVAEVARDGILKVEVSSAQPIIENGKNICTNEGTAFLISAKHAATADHVLKLPDQCGKPNIIITSRRHSWRTAANFVVSNADVALLKFEVEVPDAMCVLGIMDADLTESAPAFKIGMPARHDDPASISIDIQSPSSTFSPLVPLTPVTTEYGESGSPIIYKFNVVGILKSRHLNYTSYSFMIPRSILAKLLELQKIKNEGNICNPTRRRMVAMGTDMIATINADSKLSLEVANQVQSAIEAVDKRTAAATLFGVEIQTNKQVDNTSECIAVPGAPPVCQQVFRPSPIPSAEKILAAERESKAFQFEINNQLWRQLGRSKSGG
jgi:hypothetical protein